MPCEPDKRRKDTDKRGQCQIYLNIAEREYLRRAKDTKSRVQKQTFMFDYAETEYLRHQPTIRISECNVKFI